MARVIELMRPSPAKIPRPARVYLHVVDQTYLSDLANKVRQTSFRDAKSTWSSASLLGPPAVEFAPFGKIPGSRRRNDARQGTIDQDPEFIAFLEELTNPAPAKRKPEEEQIDAAAMKDEKKVTPLVQFLKDRKAAKEKRAATPTDARNESKVRDRRAGAKAGVDTSPAQQKANLSGKVDEAARKAVKVLNREATGSPRKAKAKATPSPKAAAAEVKANVSLPTPPPAPAAVERKRERGSASAAARILQRDLGLGSEKGRRGQRSRNQAAGNEDEQRTNTSIDKARPLSTDETPPDSKPGTCSAENPDQSTGHETARGAPKDITRASAVVSSGQNNQSPSSARKTTGPVAILTKSSSSIQLPSGPAAIRNSKAGSHGQPKETTESSTVGASPATQAFVKHANPSQGITETVLQEAMEAFGRVTKAEIDTKKGHAYVDFSEPEGLQKAMQASPVKIAEGQVVILQRKDRPSGGPAATRGGRAERGRAGAGVVGSPRGGRGRGGGSRGRGRGGGGGAPKGASRSGGASSGPLNVGGSGDGTTPAQTSESG